MEIEVKVAVITGAASGIGRAVAAELARRNVRAMAWTWAGTLMASPEKSMQRPAGRSPTPTRATRQMRLFALRFLIPSVSSSIPSLCACRPPASPATILSVRIDKITGKARIYPVDQFKQVLDVNLVAPVYWALEMIGRIAENRAERGLKRWHPTEGMQGAIVFIGSVSSQGNRGQISYASTKAGLEGAAATIMKEAVYYGVRCGLIHPGFTDTPMVRAMGDDYISRHILPYTQLSRLIRPEEIADAICFMLANSAVSGELWADAGWHAPA